MGIIVAPKEFAVLDISLREWRLEGRSEGADEVPPLIIYARARGTDGCADGVNDDDGITRDECVMSGGGRVGGRDIVLAHCRKGKDEQCRDQQ